MLRFARIAVLAGAVTALAACEPLSITAVGVGGSAAVSHTLGGITYRTFTAPAASVKAASLGALGKMGIKVTATEKGSHGSEVLKAQATDREIEITFEPLSSKTTRMKVVARNGGIFFDSATATEIILQTERQLVKT
jgi:hypothetical protein